MTWGYMNEDIGYSIIFLSKFMGLSAVEHLIPFMANFIETIKTVKIPLDWATTLSENLCEQLWTVREKKKLYMMSYIVYLLAARAIDYPRLYRKGNMQDTNTWPYIVYPQLVKKKLSA